MSVFFVQNKGWRYNFYLNKNRYAKGFYVTKAEARIAEAKRKEAIQKGLPDPEEERKREFRKESVQAAETTPTDMAFLDLVNLRLDHVRSYNSIRHYKEVFYQARAWVRMWGNLNVSQITKSVLKTYLVRVSNKSKKTANRYLRNLRALFNFGMNEGLIHTNPTTGLRFFPIEKSVKYIPPREDVVKILLAAEPDVRDYLYCLVETMGRMTEVNQLKWDDVNFEKRFVLLHTRKKRGGHLSPRAVSMTNKLFEVLSRRYQKRDPSKPWVFWHTYWSSKNGEKKEGPYQDRKRLMRSLCKKAGVKYFRYHALRHFGASILDDANVGIGAIQRILGHENRTTTEIYLHSLGYAEREAIEVFETIFHGEKKSDTPSDTPEGQTSHGKVIGIR